MPHATVCIDCEEISTQSPCPNCKTRRQLIDPYQDPRWRALTRRLTKGKTCTTCGSSRRLTVHHLHGRHPKDITIGPFAILCGACHSQYEADTRAGTTTPLTNIVDELAARAPLF